MNRPGEEIEEVPVTRSVPADPPPISEEPEAPVEVTELEDESEVMGTPVPPATGAPTRVNVSRERGFGD